MGIAVEVLEAVVEEAVVLAAEVEVEVVIEIIEMVSSSKCKFKSEPTLYTQIKMSRCPEKMSRISSPIIENT